MTHTISDACFSSAFTASLLLLGVAAGQKELLSDPSVSLGSIEAAGSVLPATEPPGFTYEPVSPSFYKSINNVTYYEFNGTYYEELNGTFVPAIAKTVNGSFTLLPATSIESAGSDGYDYGEVLGLSILFYEAQRSGVLPATNRVPWRGNSALGDKSPAGTNLAGGWYDAGDHLKLHFPAAFAASNLAWGFIEFQQGYTNADTQAYLLSSLRWIADYFVKCHHADLAFTAQVGDVNLDHSLWERAEDMQESRPSFDVTPSLPGMGKNKILVFFVETHPYATVRIFLAKFGTTFEGKYSDSIAAAFAYPSSSYLDDLAWGSVWLYKATMEDQYLEAAENYVERNIQEEGGGGYQAYNWDTSCWGVYVLMAEIQGSASPYPQKVQGFLEAWVVGDGSAVSYTPGGLAFLSVWGSLRAASNAAFIASVYANLIQGSDTTTANRYSCWARSQIRYMLGDSGRSYVVGFGKNPPTHVHHRGASCPAETSLGSNNPVCNYADYALTTPNPNVLYGALVGGPGPDDSYADLRSDYQKNEVAVDYNGGFTGVLAYLSQSTDTYQACLSRGDIVHEIVAQTNNQA